MGPGRDARRCLGIGQKPMASLVADGTLVPALRGGVHPHDYIFPRVEFFLDRLGPQPGRCLCPAWSHCHRRARTRQGLLPSPNARASFSRVACGCALAPTAGRACRAARRRRRTGGIGQRRSVPILVSTLRQSSGAGLRLEGLRMESGLSRREFASTSAYHG